ncbi:MAG: hypothetical protein HY747_11640, partial [Elusimicrobia bacterium]|nr:hypothetical protein [Elusimicrobiota bacterium]
MDTTTKFFLKALWPGIIMAAVFLIWCPLLFSIHDIEDFVLVVLFTVLQARALWDGQYPFWTPNCALGIPLPSSQHFTFHPLFPLFGLKDIKTSILIFYLEL